MPSTPLSVNTVHSSSSPRNGGLYWVWGEAAGAASTTWQPSKTFYRLSTGSWVCNSTVKEAKKDRVNLRVSLLQGQPTAAQQPHRVSPGRWNATALFCHPFTAFATFTFASLQFFRDPAGSQLLPQEIPPSPSRPPWQCQVMPDRGCWRALGLPQVATYISLSPYRATYFGFHLLLVRPHSSD